jgi:hypothetical protein
MDTRRIGDIAHDLAGVEVDDHDVGATGNVETAGGSVRGKIIPTALATDLQSFDDIVIGIGSICVNGKGQTAE